MPVIRHKAQRVCVLIDVQNFYHSAKNLYQRRVDFEAVLKQAVADRQLVRAFAYVVSTESGEERTFFEALEKLGIEIRVKDLQIFFGGAKKADWDVGIAVDAIRMSNSVDVVVLMSGDGDFVPLMDYLINQGVQTEVLAFGKSSSSRLSLLFWSFWTNCSLSELLSFSAVSSCRALMRKILFLRSSSDLTQVKSLNSEGLTCFGISILEISNSKSFLREMAFSMEA